MAGRFYKEKENTMVPILNGTNFSEWYLCMIFLLRSKDLLDICEKELSADEPTPTANKWNKASFNTINLITSKVNHCVFLEIVNYETSDNAHLLWTKIKDKYASKKALNKG
ncbi:hypothetical protein O181_049708 [Austropuccinia psidii MF-1]|uniref:DUF4219 domain-containing protein n=1 Tax=Austropuccinia psidii MF-1 TaxID=1389203 RepID=A0A9Q3HLP0_9BASI|nr:hypothetical protein [Austropuccinia psidii MF-1]